MMSDFNELAREAVAPFRDAGFTERLVHVDAVSGNGVMEIGAPDVALRLVRDRRQWSAEVRAAGETEWFSIDYVLQLLGESTSSKPLQDGAAVNALLAHVFDRLAEWRVLFSRDQYASTKARINGQEDAFVANALGMTVKR
jgi:hypothetical protein